MSSMTMFARGDRAIMLTDTASTTVEDGRFVINSWVNKMFVFPHSKLAMTVQGSTEAALMIATYLQFGYRDLDGIVAELSDLLCDLHDKYMMRWSDNASAPEFHVGVMGWSNERRRFEAYNTSSSERARVNVDAHSHEGREPFRFYRNDLVLAPMLAESDLAALGVPKDGAAFARDAENLLLRIMKLQRRVPCDSGRGYSIGGEVVATELTPAGVSQRIIHRFNDKLGEPIDIGLMSAELLVIKAESDAVAAGMSRQQRRAAKAQARKGHAHAA